MNLAEYVQYGVAIFSLAVLAYVIKLFLEFMKRQEENFKNTIDNHLEKQAEANDNLAAAVKELLNFLRWQNKMNNNNKK